MRSLLRCVREDADEELPSRRLGWRRLEQLLPNRSERINLERFKVFHSERKSIRHGMYAVRRTIDACQPRNCQSLCCGAKRANACPSTMRSSFRLRSCLVRGCPSADALGSSKARLCRGEPDSVEGCARSLHSATATDDACAAESDHSLTI